MSLQSQYVIDLHRDENSTKNRCRHNIAYPLSKYTWTINRDQVTHIFDCNHEEAGLRMVLHFTLSSADAAVVAANTMF